MSAHTVDFERAEGRAPYRNNPARWLVQFREREKVVHEIWNKRDAARTGRREVTRWTPWRTNQRFLTSTAAWSHFDHVRRAGLAQWRVTFGGKEQFRGGA